jgi:hypothetical protein
MIQIESKPGKTVGFEKQMDIKKLEDKLSVFIERNPYGTFHLRILKSDAEDIEDFKYEIVVHNFAQREHRKPTIFIISIDNTFTEMLFYQYALNGVIIPI